MRLLQPAPTASGHGDAGASDAGGGRDAELC